MSSSFSPSSPMKDLLMAGTIGAILGSSCVYYVLKHKEKTCEKDGKSTEEAAAIDGLKSLKSKLFNLYTNPTQGQRKNLGSDVIFPHEHERKMNKRLQNKPPNVTTSGTEEGQNMNNNFEKSKKGQINLSNENTSDSDTTSLHQKTDSISSLVGGVLGHEEKQKVTVRVPATSANLGPGFDTLGMAIDMWSEITVERSDKFEIIAIGEGAEDVPKDDTNLIVTGMKAAFKAANKDLPICRYTCINRIPYARGLGSSSAAIVAGVMAGLILAGHQLPCWGSEELLQIAAGIEGHPDNVAPAMYGGIQLGIYNGERWATERVQIPQGLQMVVFIPNVIGKTSTARGLLADEIPRSEAVFNIGRVAWLINALNTGNIDNLQFGVQDMMHQPQRGEHVYKHLYPMIKAAIAAGANGCYLSGAGPSIMAITCGASGDIFTQRDSERVDVKVAQAMNKVAANMGVQGQTFITEPSERGAHVVSVEPPFSGPLIKFRGEV